MSYSQFIHGKIIGERNYKLVAMTADLVGREDELEAIAYKYRFWGQQPPLANPIAVGVFHYQDGLLLAQAMSATHNNGEPALDAQSRPFSQHRYVFLPAGVLNGSSGRVWLFLNWVMAETRGIPLFRQVERNLRPIPQPQFDGRWYNPTEEQDKLCRALKLRDQGGQPVLLSALAALINGKRIVFDAADTGGIFSEDLLEGILLLLPAVVRAQVSIAAGALDEQVCTQARLMVKTNGTPKGPLEGDLIWAKRADNQFFGTTNGDIWRSNYTALLQPILAQANSIDILLRILDDIADLPSVSYVSPWQALDNGWLATRLIPAMPDPEQRAKYWRSALHGLSPEEWRKIMPAIIDETGLEIAWTELQKAAKRQPSHYAPLVFLLWRNFSRAYIAYVLQQELPADLELAEVLLRHGLLAELGPEHQADRFSLCLAVITGLARKRQKQAVDLANTLLKGGWFDKLSEQLALKETALLSHPDRTTLLDFFNAEMAPLLPDLSAAELTQSQVYRQMQRLDPEGAELMERVANQQSRALAALADLAAHTSMDAAQSSRFYAACLAAWEPSYTAARPLLTDLVTRWIADYPPDERPPLVSVLRGVVDWTQAHAPPEIGRLLMDPQVERSLADWQILAQHLFDNPLGQVSFMDHVTVGQPAIPMSQQWLTVLAEDQEAKTNFEASYTWHNLRAEGPAWLAEAVAQLLGWQESSISALLPLIERLQTALTLPQTLIFKLLEALPRRGDDNLGLILAAQLPGLMADKAVEVESLPLWQLLNTQAPKVAQVYKTLAEGQTNMAVDMFNQRKLNSALSEAPEYAEAMAHWLQLCGKGDWISGRLLETMVQRWAADPASLDLTLLTGLLQPDLAEQYGVADWIALAKVCWLPDYQALWPMSGQPGLNIRQRTQVLSLAKDCIKLYARPGQTERLVTACRNWGLDHDDLAELMSHAPEKACNFSLLNTYLYLNGSLLNVNSPIAQNLFALAMRLQPSGELEQTHLKTFLTNLAQEQLRRDEGVSFLANWGQLVNDKQVYQGAVTDAALQLAPGHFSLLVKRAHQLKGLKATSLSQALTQALDQYWLSEKRNLSG